jgi:hypothetical protein
MDVWKTKRLLSWGNKTVWIFSEHLDWEKISGRIVAALMQQAC